MNSTPLSSNAALILVVDDDPFARIQLRRFLEREGYRIEEAEDGKAGLESYIRLQPDIVLLDAIMPAMNGFECCAKLQAVPADHHIPILMITGLDDQESVDQAFDVGAVDYITKPIHWAVLRQRVRRLIQQTQLQQQLETANRRLEEANQMLHRLAMSDGLTQIANRRYFDEHFEREWRRLAREQLPLSMILCDVDFFKSYNDTYGHQAGDACLKQVARAIDASIRRPTDLAARYGGEEFVVILPNTKSEGAVEIAQRIRDSIKALAIPHSGAVVNQQITLSLGIASTIPQPNSSPASLIEAADKMLYQAKQAGRDTYCVATI